MKKKDQLFRSWRRLGIATGAVALLVAMTPNRAPAAQLELTYSGMLNSQDALNPALQSSPSYFASSTAFTINAWFDTSSPNLAPPLHGPFAGFRAYDPSSATISIGGMMYSIETIGANPLAGISVAIFDQNSFTPGHYGVGILQNPPKDGAGIIGDFLSSSPNFTAAKITPTTFGGYWGVGYGSGVCLQGTGGNCSDNAVTPLVLQNGAGLMFNLTLGNYNEDYPVAHSPSTPVGALNSASLTATPEPGTCALAGLAFAAIIGFAKRRGR